jgi:hypothetical protein
MMPNWVTNKITVRADRAERLRIFEAIKDDKLGPGSIDFNKLIPMPKELDIESGSRSDMAIKIHKTMEENGITFRGDGYFGFADMDRAKTGAMEFLNKYAGEIKKDPEIIGFGKICAENEKKYGHATWYGWRSENWGSKWNAYGFGERPEFSPDDDTLIFDTAWTGVPEIAKKISELSPGAHIEYRYADEDFGYNTGAYEFLGGETLSEHHPAPGSKEAYEAAADIMGIDLGSEDSDFILSADGSTYIDLESDGYRAINLLDNPVLFSTKTLAESDVPKGLCLSYLRQSPDSSKLAMFRKAGNYDDLKLLGTIVSKQSFGLEDKGIIVFKNKGFPDEICDNVSFREYLDGDYGPAPRQEGGIEMT